MLRSLLAALALAAGRYGFPSGNLVDPTFDGRGEQKQRTKEDNKKVRFLLMLVFGFFIMLAILFSIPAWIDANKPRSPPLPPEPSPPPYSTPIT